MILSVIVPYFNRNAFIGKTLDTLLNQDIPSSEYEIIVVDDESDEKPIVLKDYVKRFPQVRYIRKKHSGLPLTRNFGISVAQGDWLYFCDGDDFVQPQVFGGIIATAEERQLEMIYAKVRRLAPSDQIPEPRRNFSVVSETMSGMEYIRKNTFTFGVWSYLIRSSFVKAQGLSFKDFIYEDRIFLLDLIPFVSRVARIDVDLYYYVQHANSIMHMKRKSNGSKYVAPLFIVLDKLTALIKEYSISPQTNDGLLAIRANNASMVLNNAFRYCSVKETINCIARLKEMGAYPIGKSNNKRVRKYRILMNHKNLWIFLCQCYHFFNKTT